MAADDLTWSRVVALVHGSGFRRIISGEAPIRSRTLAGQLVEVQLACRVLNTMARLGMPDSYRVG